MWDHSSYLTALRVALGGEPNYAETYLILQLAKAIGKPEGAGCYSSLRTVNFER